jgi:hypothetical protein
LILANGMLASPNSDKCAPSASSEMFRNKLSVSAKVQQTFFGSMCFLRVHDRRATYMRRLRGMAVAIVLMASPAIASEDLMCGARVSHFCDAQRCVTRFFPDRLKLEFSRSRVEFCRSGTDCEEHTLVAEETDGHILVRAGPEIFAKLSQSGEVLLMNTAADGFARVMFLTCAHSKPAW